MPPLLSTQDITTTKLQSQKNPKMLLADFDGTLFSPNHHIITAPFRNRKIAEYLKSFDIPFVLVTGRNDWQVIDETQLALLGLPSPDNVITANGTIMYHQLTNKTYARDMEWESYMQYNKVTWADGKIETWNKPEITSLLKDYLLTQKYPFTFETGNTFLIRLRVKNIPLFSLEQVRKDILTLFPSGLRIIYTEKLLHKNTTNTFSGEMLVTPKLGGKDNAVKYLLERYAKEIQRMQHISLGKSETKTPKPKNRLSAKAQDEQSIIHAFIFGDATVDIPMLIMKSNPKFFTLSQYLVNPTPLAIASAQKAQKTNANLHIVLEDGPQTIANVLTNPYHSTESLVDESRSFAQNIPDTSQQTDGAHIPSMQIETTKQSKNEKRRQSSLSPAQNNPSRRLIKMFEPLLDKIIDKNLSPNEISFLGLTKLSEGLKKIYSSNSSSFAKLHGMYNYGFGNLTDVLDGIRARNSDKKEENGQLIDGFSDRVKEFIQLFIRGKNRLTMLNRKRESNPQNRHPERSEGSSQQLALQTFLTALSCTLPSIARAQVEILGKVVPERDEKGGSMIDRTKKLSLSLFMDTIGAHKKSEAIDQQIYSANIATFQNRLSIITSQADKSLARHPEIIAETLSEFQQKALERWLLYIDVLQQEDVIMKKYLAKYPKVLKSYEKESQKLAKDYLALKINSLRKKWHIQDYKLQIKTFLV